MTIYFIQSTKKLLTLALILFFFHSIVLCQIPVRNENGYILMDEDGELYDNTYDYIGEKSANLYVCVKNGQWGYLNWSGKETITPRYDVAYPFKGKFALVGKDYKYFHITQDNKKLAMYVAPKAPLVFENQFLVVNEDIQAVYNHLGDEIFGSSNELYCASETGIIEWIKDRDSLILYKGHHQGNELIKIEEYPNVSSFEITNQGYLCLVSDQDSLKMYTLLGKYGRVLGRHIGGSINPNHVRTVWNNYIYWGEGTLSHPEREFGTEVHFPMKYLSPMNEDSPSNMPFQLCDKYMDERVAFIPEIFKWLPFDGSSVNGSRMFDDVYGGDRKMTPVKIYDQWYLYSPREDSLIHTGFKRIHAAGYNNSRFFASNQNPGTYEPKWAFINLKENIQTEEIFGLPVVSQKIEFLNDNFNFYEWNSELNEVIYKGQKTYINRQGEVIWSNPIGKGFTPNDFFKTEFQLSNYLVTELPENHNYKNKEFQVVLTNIQNGIEVSLANTTKKDVSIEVQDGYFIAQLEQKITDGSWKVIAKLDPSFCGNSFYPYKFPANAKATTKVSLPKGNREVLLRVVITNNLSKKNLISNTILVQTNSGRLWIKDYVSGFGLEQQKIENLD